MNLLEKVNNSNLRKDMPVFRPGDTVRVHVKVKEGDKERVQLFEGVVIRRKRGGITSSFTVRKVSFGVGVERIFPAHSPSIDKVEVVSTGRVRRSKLYYLRKLMGKAARIESELTVADVLPEETPAEEAKQA